LLSATIFLLIASTTDVKLLVCWAVPHWQEIYPQGLISFIRPMLINRDPVYC